MGVQPPPPPPPSLGLGHFGGGWVGAEGSRRRRRRRRRSELVNRWGRVGEDGRLETVSGGLKMGGWKRFGRGVQKELNFLFGKDRP